MAVLDLLSGYACIAGSLEPSANLSLLLRLLLAAVGVIFLLCGGGLWELRPFGSPLRGNPEFSGLFYCCPQ